MIIVFIHEFFVFCFTKKAEKIVKRIIIHYVLIKMLYIPAILNRKMSFSG